MAEGDRQLAEREQEVERLREAVYWALGMRGAFRLRADGEGAFWWRKELRRRALENDDG